MLEKIAVFIFGACLGSFLNVCIHRLPRNQSVAKPRSFCPNCKSTIKWYDNIPLLSYLILRAKCRNCQARIALRYPLVELLSAVLILILYLKFGFSLLLFKFSFFFVLLILVSFIDIDYHAIPVYLCVIGIAVGLALTVWPSLKMLKTGIDSLESLPLFKAFRGLIFGFGFTYLFKFFGDVFIDFYLKARGKQSIEGETESLGLGDVDFMGMVGVYLGLKSVVLVFFMAPFFAVIYSIFALVFKRSHLIPYLPYLSLAALTYFFWGSKILSFIL